MGTATGKLTFRGGVHPPEKKELTADRPIEQGPQCKQAAVLLSQHIGAPCEPQVSKGDQVQMGQVIGSSDAFVSAPVHAPFAGKVKAIELRSHPVLGRFKAIVIERTEGDDQVKEPVGDQFSAKFDAEQYTPEHICEVLRTAGLVGMGGAGFPTRVKVEPNPQMPKDIMVINGCECEPYITCDYRVMLEWAHQVIAGIKLARRGSGCKEVYIAIEDNKPKAAEVMDAALRDGGDADGMQVVQVKTKYPQGGERQLINSVLGKVVPSGGIPPMIGVLALNVATAAAIAEAVTLGNPLTHRVVTVTGEAIAKPGNYYVPVGTPVQDLIVFCGGVTQESAKVVLGGPMMGFAIGDLQTPITKTSGAVTVLTAEQIGRAKFERRQTPCIRCGRCLTACPERLNPTRIAHAVEHNMLDVAENYYISACIECGCCSYVCPANIELTGLIKTGKIYLARQRKRMPE